MTVNTTYFDDLVNRINAVDNEAHFERLALHLTASQQKQKDAVTAQIAKLAPFAALATAPTTDPASIVSWITNMITANVAPQVVVHTALIADATALATQATRVTSALASAKSRLGSTITIPPIT